MICQGPLSRQKTFAARGKNIKQLIFVHNGPSPLAFLGCHINCFKTTLAGGIKPKSLATTPTTSMATTNMATTSTATTPMATTSMAATSIESS